MDFCLRVTGLLCLGILCPCRTANSRWKHVFEMLLPLLLSLGGSCAIFNWIPWCNWVGEGGSTLVLLMHSGGRSAHISTYVGIHHQWWSLKDNDEKWWSNTDQWWPTLIPTSIGLPHQWWSMITNGDQWWSITDQWWPTLIPHSIAIGLPHQWW